MAKYSFRLQGIDDPKLQDLFALLGVKGDSFSDEMSDLIVRLHKSLILDKKSLSPSDFESEQKRLDTEVSCERRIFERGQYSCVNRPPRSVKLISLQICRVCKALRLGFPSKTFTGDKTPAAAPIQSEIDKLKAMMPPDLAKLVTFEDKGEYIKVQSKRFLERDQFRQVSQFVLAVKGDYISMGKDSHFRVPKAKPENVKKGE